ncbi:MAG TPA: hypothetical protein VIP52_16525 [Candidatus Dormibacteraeota bacterium]
MRPVFMAFLIAFSAASWASLAPVSVSASCAYLPGQAPGGLSAAPVLFVGTVTSTGNGARVATVRVESVWRGPEIPTYVRVVGTPVSGFNQASSVDRTYQAGQRYLFVPTNSSSPFQDNRCTATQPFTSATASLAPADARAPLPGGDPGPPWVADVLPWIVALVALVAVGVAAGLWIRHRRRHRAA